jgi:hypothetical protein
MKKLLTFVFPITLLCIACNREEKFTTDNGDKLEFSVDTLRFDTVFTELGSATRFLRVYNPHKESIRISKIYLAGNQQSKFNLNVDGIPGDMHEDVVVYPKDSIYIFAEVTINPDDPLSTSPFFVYDSVIFETNGNVQSVTLEAFGQNANYFPSRWHKDSVQIFTCQGDVVWDDPKPYVIYGIIGFTDCTVTWPAGARIHIHGGLTRRVFTPDSILAYNSGRIDFYQGASLRVEGTAENPVIIQGDRLEEAFSEEPGQWVGIYLSPGSGAHRFEYATLKNSLFGIYADSSTDLTLKNVQLVNTSGVGVLGAHASITAENCLFYNNGNHCLQLVYGGHYDFTYCTLANYGSNAPALYMDNGLCGDQFCNIVLGVNDLDVSFINSIIFGSKRDEISLADIAQGEAAFNYSFANCIVRVNELTDPLQGFPDFFDHCNPCINATPQDLLFEDPNEDDYRLDSLSIAEEMALPIPGILLDLVGTLRDAAKPDIGCFEYKPE